MLLEKKTFGNGGKNDIWSQSFDMGFEKGRI